MYGPTSPRTCMVALASVGDTQVMEKVPKRPVRVSSTYQARSEEVSLPFFETRRRIHDDLALAYKIVRRKDDVTWFDLVGQRAP